MHEHWRFPLSVWEAGGSSPRNLSIKFERKQLQQSKSAFYVETASPIVSAFTAPLHALIRGAIVKTKQTRCFDRSIE
jgi:hypothetical protein